MILYFENEIDDIVYYGYRRYRVSKYVAEITRCYKCQRFNHRAINCTAKKETCAICAEAHSTRTCPKKDNHREQQTAVCPNCKGPHPASYQGCPKYQWAKKVQFTRILGSISYAEAVKKCKADEERKKAKDTAKKADDTESKANKAAPSSGQNRNNEKKSSSRTTWRSEKEPKCPT